MHGFETIGGRNVTFCLFCYPTQTDDRTKSIVFGYTRESSNNLSMNIPQIIQYIFLMYYWIQERFTMHGDALVIDEHNHNLIRCKLGYTKSNMLYNTVYGNDKVINFNDTSIAKYEWSFKVLVKHGILTFGIDNSKDNELVNTGFCHCNHRFASIATDSVVCVSSEFELIAGWPIGWFSGLIYQNVINIMLDVTEGTSSFRHNGDGTKYLFARAKKLEYLVGDGYRLAISIPVWTKGNQVGLIGFKVHHKNNK